MKLIIPVKKPRNPIVVPAQRRKAGKMLDKKRKDKHNPPIETDKE